MRRLGEPASGHRRQRVAARSSSRSPSTRRWRAVVAGRRRDRRLMRSAANAVMARVRRDRCWPRSSLLVRARPPRLLDRGRRRAHQPRAAAALPADGALGEPAGLAAAVADGAGAAPRPLVMLPEPAPQPRADAVGDGRAGRRSWCSSPAMAAFVSLAVRARGGRRAGRRLRASTRRCRTRTWSPTRRRSTWATSRWPCRSRSRWPRWSPAARTRAGWSRCGAGRCSRGRRSGVGMLLGAHWAYVEIGWGGYWAWDPVENAALMPWLAATAFLHSVMVQEKKGMLKVWNMVLVIGRVLAVAASARSSPAAASSTRSTRSCSRTSGPYLLGFIAVVLAFATALLIVAPAAAAQRAPAGVGRLARGHVPVQQPAAAGAGVRHPLGRGLPGPERGRARRPLDRVDALLQLLPGRVRAAAAGADRASAR